MAWHVSPRDGLIRYGSEEGTFRYDASTDAMAGEDRVRHSGLQRDHPSSIAVSAVKRAQG